VAVLEEVAVVGLERVADRTERVLVVELGHRVVDERNAMVDLDGDGAVAGDVGAAQSVGFDCGALVDVEPAPVVGDVHDISSFAHDHRQERVVAQDLSHRFDRDRSDSGDLARLTGQRVRSEVKSDIGTTTDTGAHHAALAGSPSWHRCEEQTRGSGPSGRSGCSCLRRSATCRPSAKNW